MKRKYLYAMLTWPYKSLGKTLLSPILHVFAKLHYFIRCKLSDTPSVLELRVFWDLPSVVNTRTGRLLCLGCRGAVWCSKRWMQPLLSTCTSSQLTRKATTGRAVLGQHKHQWCSYEKKAGSLVPFLISSRSRHCWKHTPFCSLDF